VSDVVDKGDESSAEVPPLFQGLEGLLVVSKALDQYGKATQYNASDLKTRHWGLVIARGVDMSEEEKRKAGKCEGQNEAFEKKTKRVAAERRRVRITVGSPGANNINRRASSPFGP
jgi:hypothetical protein